jgi:hypothetical protein
MLGICGHKPFQEFGIGIDAHMIGLDKDEYSKIKKNSCAEMKL